MQVARPELQHQTMIEAVENHMPEVIVIDEIGTELEAQAARTIAERGVSRRHSPRQCFGQPDQEPHPQRSGGGIQAVTLGDEEARRRRSQKTVLERAAEPTFPVAVEMHSRQRWAVHTDVAATVDQLLRGLKPRVQERELTPEGAFSWWTRLRLPVCCGLRPNGRLRISRSPLPCPCLRPVTERSVQQRNQLRRRPAPSLCRFSVAGFLPVWWRRPSGPTAGRLGLWRT